MPVCRSGRQELESHPTQSPDRRDRVGKDLRFTIARIRERDPALSSTRIIKLTFADIGLLPSSVHIGGGYQ